MECNAAPPKFDGLGKDKEEEPRKIKTHEDLVIYQKAFNAAMTILPPCLPSLALTTM